MANSEMVCGRVKKSRLEQQTVGDAKYNLRVFSLEKCGLGKRREISNVTKGVKKKRRGGAFSPLDGIALGALLSQSQKPGNCIFDICQTDSIPNFSCWCRLLWSLNSSEDGN